MKRSNSAIAQSVPDRADLTMVGQSRQRRHDRVEPVGQCGGAGLQDQGDLISVMRPSRTAGIASQPGRAAIFSGRTFLPHHDARITSGAASQ